MITSYFDRIQRGLLNPSLYEPKKLKGLERLFMVMYGGAIGVMIILLITLSMYGEPETNIMFPSVMAAMVMLLIGNMILHSVTYKKTLCMALAGIEEGHWHSADDLHLWLDIPTVIGERIIAGDYDDLLRDELTCKFIGK